MLLGGAAHAQTTCSLSQKEAGVYLCFPSNSETSEVPALVHISAQINAPEGKSVSGYSIKVDDVAVGVDVERVPPRQLAVEGTLGMPLAPGKHSLKIEAAGIGEVSTKIIVKPTEGIVPCATVTNFPQWLCTSRPVQAVPTPASLLAPAENRSKSSFEQFAYALLSQFESLQLDSMEVAAFDDAGNIYTASHTLSDIEVRKYGPGGARLEFATVVSSCGAGFTALDGIAIAADGQVWIAGHSTACFRPTPIALEHEPVAASGEERSFLLRVNAKLNGAPPLSYFSFLPNGAGSRVTGLRADQTGNVYIAGSTTSSAFPHQNTLALSARNSGSPLSFLAVLKADGSALLNSALLQGIRVSALAIDKDAIAIAGDGESPASGRQGSASCCSEILAKLRPDLSAVASFTRVPHQGKVSISALAAITGNGLLAVGYAKQPAGARINTEPIREMIYSWSSDSPRACSELISGPAPPAIVNTPALDAYARHASSTGFCAPDVSSQPH